MSGESPFSHKATRIVSKEHVLTDTHLYRLPGYTNSSSILSASNKSPL